MLKTLIYKFKKRELGDSPPDITLTEDNWDIVERELNKITSSSFSSKGLVENMDLLDYIKTIPKGESVSIYVRGTVTNTPINGKFYIMQIYKNGFTGDVHIEAQEFLQNDLIGNNYYTDLWNFTKTVIPWKQVATTRKEEVQLTPMNGWEKTGNDLCRLIVFGDNTGLLQLELKATKPIANLDCVKMELPYVPRKSFSPIICDIGGRSSKGYVYNNGSVKISSSANTNELLTMNMVIDLI